MPTPTDHTRNPYDAARWKRAASAVQPRYAFQAETHADATRWQRQLRRRFIQRLGGFPAEAAPLRPRVVARDEFDDYTRETVHFTSRTGLMVFAYFLLPRGASGLLPALLCLHGHGYGVDALVGLNAHGQPRPVGENEYHHDFALQAVRRGYAVLAPELLGFGRRREGTFPLGSHGSSCQTLSGTALMLGQTMAGWRVYDAMRSVDYMATRPEVDTTRIGTIGISGGGLNALYLAAVDTRVRATVVSGFLNTFRDSIMAVSHCIDNFVPGLLQDAEMSDIAGLVAPRALWCENGDADTIFPAPAFRRALRDVKKIYKVFDASDHLGGEVFPGEHQFHGAGAWPFLARWL